MGNDSIEREERQSVPPKSSTAMDVEEQESAKMAESTEEEKLGPEDAASHWTAFYRSVRDAVTALRSKHE